jgi:putative ABC transport system substrate-binding protein
MVTEPVGTGAGRDFTHHLSNITGAVWPAPLEPGFVWLKRLFPGCRRVGVIYNAAEANSRTEIALARRMLAPLGMELEERTLASSSEITEALSSVLAARVDAVFGLSDNTVTSAFAALATTCRRERIPLLADDDTLMGTGALLACGVSPRANGLYAGRMAARVLLGESPAAIPFEPTTVHELSVDLAAAAQLGLDLPPALLLEADIFHRALAGPPGSRSSTSCRRTISMRPRKACGAACASPAWPKAPTSSSGDSTPRARSANCRRLSMPRWPASPIWSSR